MEKVANFAKISFEQFQKDMLNTLPDIPMDIIQDTYEKIKLPKRATRGSAGYDFYAPFNITLQPGETVKIPTGIRVNIKEGWVLLCFPRSGLGFKYRLQLDNTVGVIDADYFDSDNEGHIFAKITNDSHEKKSLSINSGDGFMQGIFVAFGITQNDSVTAMRNGGFGSTTGKQA